MERRELLINTALIPADLTIYERAELLIKKAIEDYTMKFGDEHPFTLTTMKRLAWVYKTANCLERRGRSGESQYLKEGQKLEAMAGILSREGYYSQMTTRKVAHLARNYDEELITLLLDRRGNEVTITEEIVKAAA